MKTRLPKTASLLSRRDFLAKTALATSAVALHGRLAMPGAAAEPGSIPIVVFTKVYQPLNLTFEETAALTLEAGLDGVDCPVRPGGQIVPERAADELPRYNAELRKRNLRLPLITTAITGVDSPHAEQILRTGKKMGVQFYRLGYVNRSKDLPFEKQAPEIKARLKDLAALNKEIGVGALFQNHSGGTTIGGNLAEMVKIVSDFDPNQVGVAFDIGHALIVHGEEWRSYFEKLKSHLKIAYVKDATRAGHFVRFGQGDIGKLGYFTLLKQMGYQAPICMHIEYEWAPKGQPQTRPALAATMQADLRVLKDWLAEA
jgi:sugar phosphate isomerase/epimerase